MRVHAPLRAHASRIGRCSASCQASSSTVPEHVTHVAPGHEETHVDRSLNVLASGVRTPLFRGFRADPAIAIFAREPLAEQPRFVADMGCGDGIWLERIYEIVAAKTLRGRHLDEYPLLMIGADYNAKALEAARRTLDTAGVPHITLFGDVTDPTLFAQALGERGLAIVDGLHIRAFIDHNRRFTEPRYKASAEERLGLSTGAYAGETGNAIPNRLLEENLVEHLRRWAPFISKHGLIVIEAHNVYPRSPPSTTAKPTPQPSIPITGIRTNTLSTTKRSCRLRRKGGIPRRRP